MVNTCFFTRLTVVQLKGQILIMLDTGNHHELMGLDWFHTAAPEGRMQALLSQARGDISA